MGGGLFNQPFSQLAGVLKVLRKLLLALPGFVLFVEQGDLAAGVVAEGKLQLDDFVRDVSETVGQMLQCPLEVPEMPGAKRRPRCLTEGCTGYRRRVSRKDGNAFLAWPVCKATFSQDKDGQPLPKKLYTGEVIEADCPLGYGRKARQFSGT